MNDQTSQGLAEFVIPKFKGLVVTGSLISKRALKRQYVIGRALHNVQTGPPHGPETLTVLAAGKLLKISLSLRALPLLLKSCFAVGRPAKVGSWSSIASHIEDLVVAKVKDLVSPKLMASFHDNSLLLGRIRDGVLVKRLEGIVLRHDEMRC